MNQQVRVAGDLIDWVDGRPRLLGSRCEACGNVSFPEQSSCPRCASEDVRSTALAARGTLWSWTVQAFEPKPPYRRLPGEFQPFGVGYVDLGDVIVESRLTVSDADAMAIGMPMELVLQPVWCTEDDETAFTYAFAPVAS